MLNARKLAVLAPALGLAMPLAANVLVKSPVDGSTVNQSVQYSATATATGCSKGIGAMGVYVDNSLIYVVHASALSNTLSLTPGSHQTVVEEWDRCGNASFTKVHITVAPPTPAATPAISLPSGSYVGPQTVSISDSTPGAIIYYSTNGSTPTSASYVYSGAITVSQNETVSAIATANGFSSSSMARSSFTIAPPPQAAVPAFSLPSGSYVGSQTISLSDATPGAVIYYTTNGMAPTTASAIYAGPFTVGQNETVSAVATAAGYTNSAMSLANYTITQPPPAAAPVISLPSGTYVGAQTVSLADSTPGAVIYYTTNGSVPTTASAIYAGPISVTASETVAVIATAANYTNSATAIASYVINQPPPAAAPVFSLASGSYMGSQTLTLTDATASAIIYFTTNGTPPSTASPIYSGPITVSKSETIMAIATATNYTTSAAASASYVINAAPAGPQIPTGATKSTGIQLLPNWTYRHDPGTSGNSVGAMSLVGNPSLSGTAAQFVTSFTNWGGEIYYKSYAIDAVSSNFVYDAQVWIAAGSNVGNLEMDMNQVIANGNTLIYGFQCDGDNGTWDYSANTGALAQSSIRWRHSNQPCNPAKWTTNAWHHIQISYSRDAVGNLTYNSVWLDGVEAPINETVPGAESLHWAKGDLLTNFQIDGKGASGNSTVYLDNLTIYRW